MAGSSGSGGTGNEAKPSFTFEQIVLRFVVGVIFLALLVMVIELGQVRGRVHKLETGGAPALAPATQDPLGSPQSFKIVLKEMEVVPKAVEIPAGTPLTLNVVNQGQTPHNLALDSGPKTPDLKTGQTATLEVGTVTKAMTGACSIPGHKEAGMTFEVRLSGAAPPRPRRPPSTPTRAWTTAPSSIPTPPHRPAGMPTTPGWRPPPGAASISSR